MYDMAHENARPGECGKCHGTGLYRWGAVVNGSPQHEGQCHSCKGTGRQSPKDMARNRAYNRHKLASLMR